MELPVFLFHVSKKTSMLRNNLNLNELETIGC